MSDELASSQKPRPRQGWLVYLLASIFLILVAIFVFLVSQNNWGSSSAEPTATVTVTSSTDPTSTTSTTTSSTEPARIVDEGVTWITPQALPDQGIVTKKQGNELIEIEYVGTKYYKVGSTSSGSDIILAKIEVSEMGSGYVFERFLKKGTSFDWLQTNSDKLGLDYAFEMNYARVDPIILQSILSPALIVNGKTHLVKTGSMDRNPDYVESSIDTKIGTTQWGDLYKHSGDGVTDPRNNTDYAKLAVNSYYVKLNDSTHEQYIPTGSFVRDDNTFDLQFTTNTEAANAYKFDKLATGGCGMGGGTFPVLTDATQLANKKLLGRNGTANVYYLDDVNNDIVKFGYEMYKIGRNVSELKSIAEFVANYGIVFWEDAYGSTIVYMNTDWAPQAECGKPVVYLYPETDTQINVQVGAKITKSEPEYGNGWSVLAKPNGQLVLNGQAYPNLFWEGLGYGQYPAITAGTVVARADVASTIESQLKQMGLNAQEIADFNEFWLPKMPNQPYVRLTWLQNKEMNELAPLKISPAPKSLIRVFLDFQGYDQKINIPAQQLISYPRIGYTAVEWGGLLK